MTRLYIVEGPPCSGKSTTAQYIAHRLTALGRNVKCFDEGSGDHPADYEDRAFVDETAFARFPEPLRAKIRLCPERAMDGYIVPLSQFAGEDFQALLPYKIYDFLPWETEMPLMLDKWRRFVENGEKGFVYVFNCVFLQNPMCETMMRFGFSEEQSLDYIMKIAEQIDALAPVVIYLKNDCVSQSIRNTAKEREGWLEGVIDYHVNGGYGRSIHAQGFDGYIACLEERQRRELAILERLPVKRLVLENPQRDWAGAYKRIAGFLRNLEDSDAC